jgi:hypothetical protein
MRVLSVHASKARFAGFLAVASVMLSLLTGCYESPLIGDDTHQAAGHDDTDGTAVFGGLTPEAFFKQFNYRKEGSAPAYVHSYLASPWTVMRKVEDGAIYFRASLVLQSDGQYILQYQEGLGDSGGYGVDQAFHSRVHTGKVLPEENHLNLGVGNGYAYKIDGQPALRLRIGMVLNTPGASAVDLVLRTISTQESPDDLKKNLAELDESSWLRGSWRAASSTQFPGFGLSIAPDHGPKYFYEEFDGSGDDSQCRVRYISPEFDLQGELNQSEVSYTLVARRKSAELAPGSSDSSRCKDWVNRMRDAINQGGGSVPTTWAFKRVSAGNVLVNGNTTYYRQ